MSLPPPNFLLRENKKHFLGQEKFDEKSLIPDLEVLRELFCQFTSKDDANTKIVCKREYAPNSAKPGQK